MSVIYFTKAVIHWNGKDYPVNGLDSAAYTDNRTQSIIRNKNGFGNLKTMSGHDQPEQLVLTATTLEEPVDDVLQAIYNAFKDNNQTCTVLLYNEQNNTRKVLDKAVVQTPTFQTNIDDNAASKFTITFNGTLTTFENWNYVQTA